MYYIHFNVDVYYMEQPINENNVTPPQQQASSGEESILVNTINKLNNPAVYFFVFSYLLFVHVLYYLRNQDLI